MSGRIVYVGNLPLDIRERDLEDIFYKYGRIRNVDLKKQNRPPAFAFIEFEDARDASDAVKARDGYDFDGHRLRVEVSHGGSRGRGDRDRGDRGDRGGGSGSRGLGPSPYGPSKRTDYRVIVTGLPASCSWQDLKDHMRAGGEVTFAQVMRDGKGMLGLVDYANADDLTYALRKLDDTEFKNPFDKAYIRVKEDKERPGRSRSPRRARSASRSRSRDRSRGRSRDRSRDRPKDKNRSRSRDKSVSPSRSRSRSNARSVSKSPDKSRSRSRSSSRSKSD